MEYQTGLKSLPVLVDAFAFVCLDNYRVFEWCNNLLTIYQIKSCSSFIYFLLLLFFFFFAQIQHPDLDLYFDSFDGTRHVPSKWLAAIYPED